MIKVVQTSVQLATPPAITSKAFTRSLRIYLKKDDQSNWSKNGGHEILAKFVCDYCCSGDFGISLLLLFLDAAVWIHLDWNSAFPSATGIH
jgi:hypothetical protein